MTSFSRIYHGGGIGRRGWPMTASAVNTIAFGQIDHTLDEIQLMPQKMLVVNNTDATLWTINWGDTTDITGMQMYVGIDYAKCLPGKPLTIDFSRQYIYHVLNQYDPIKYLLVGWQEGDFILRDYWASAMDTETTTPNRTVDQWTRIYSPYDVAPWHTIRWTCTFTFVYKRLFNSAYPFNFLLTSVIRNKSESRLVVP